MKIRLGDWLASQFNPAPAVRTARLWIKQGKIYPPPTKVGRAYYVDESAIFMGDAAGDKHGHHQR